MTTPNTPNPYALRNIQPGDIEVTRDPGEIAGGAGRSGSPVRKVIEALDVGEWAVLPTIDDEEALRLARKAVSVLVASMNTRGKSEGRHYICRVTVDGRIAILRDDPTTDKEAVDQ